LQFLGRGDHQVKIRGFRIELGEIEAAIARHPGVKECFVCVDADLHGSKRLCAYVVPREQGESLTQELRAFLGRNLPDYMVPVAIVTVNLLPLNANGKVDRKALPAPHVEASAMVAAESDQELALARIWGELLGLSEVSILDNFFALGGDSIKAIQVVARLRGAGYGVEIPLLFEHQSITELAPHLTPLIRPTTVDDFPPTMLDDREVANIFADLNIV
jgi:aryl carrier-like protein